MLREHLSAVLNGYSRAKAEIFTGHELARFIRNGLPQALSRLAEDNPRYRFLASAGQSRWADCPWAAVLNILITSSPERGFYVAYLFRKDMNGVYLSLHQGVTGLRGDSGSRAKQRLSLEAARCRSQLGPLAPRLSATPLNLAAESPSSRSAFYEAGNICAIYYDASNLPSDETLISDYHVLLSLYESLIESKNREEAAIQLGWQGSLSVELVEDLAAIQMHERIERCPTLSRKVKRILGYTCQACGFDFERFYGPLGAGYVEAHHLIPRSQLRGQRIAWNPARDFAVLCSNCHRIIHRYDRPQDIQGFKSLIAHRDDRALEGHRLNGSCTTGV